MTPRIDFKKLIVEGAFAALVAALLFFHLVGLPTVDRAGVLGIQTDWPGFALAVAAVFIGRILVGVIGALRKPRVKNTQSIATRQKLYNRIMLALLIAAAVLPFTPLSSRYVLDVITLIFIYMMLAVGLNIVVGMTGLLDLGYVAFYAIGAYSFGLLATNLGFTFWQALPFAIVVAGCIALCLGLVVLRLRGDYLAIVTLGFAEIMRIILINWGSFTGGANGVSSIPRPDLFGMSFAGEQRVMYLYYLGLIFFIFVAALAARLKKLPLGRAFEAVREDELAARAMGMDTTRIRLAAYVLSACCGALAGAFFATKQGFVSPESFTFVESGLVLAIVVLAGMGHPLGIMLGAAFLIGLPEVFRDVQEFRMIAFGAGMVLIMIWRPEGLFAQRAPSISLNAAQDS
jgi:branched-chain amino acid transport system permease protein